MGGRASTLVLSGLVGAAAFAAALKLQYATLLLLGVAAAILLVRDTLLTKRVATIAVAAGFVFVACLGLGQAIQNHSQLGVFEPVSERARAEWYGAWTAVFVVHPSNQHVPGLAPYYDNGVWHTYMQNVEKTEPSYRARVRIFRRHIAEMFKAAHTTKQHEELASFWGALHGGRTDDYGRWIPWAAALRTDEANRRADVNFLFAYSGEQAVLRAVNHGESIQIACQPGVCSANCGSRSRTFWRGERSSPSCRWS